MRVSSRTGGFCRARGILCKSCAGAGEESDQEGAETHQGAAHGLTSFLTGLVVRRGASGAMPDTPPKPTIPQSLALVLSTWSLRPRTLNLVPCPLSCYTF